MDLKYLLDNNKYIITEGSVVERIRRNPSLQFDEYLANAKLIYNGNGREALTEIYKNYIDIARNADLPILILTPTWRANKERTEKAGCDISVNEDNFAFLDSIRKEYGDFAQKVLIGGLIGCANDAYNPSEALSMEAAEEFHSWQLEKLHNAGVDFYIASTLPNLMEAAGIAKAMSKFNIPYILSFVIRNDGTLLDGTTLHKAVSFIDSQVNPCPSFYMINCVHPSILGQALKAESSHLPLLKERLIGIQANTSDRSPEELDGSSELHCEDPDIFAEGLIQLHKEYGLKVLGGCCGTDERHIRAIAESHT